MLVLDVRFGSVTILEPRVHADARGFFCETFQKEDFARAGIRCEFVQDNHALSRHRGVVRGLHFQRPPHAQAKLIRVLRGSIFDVVVDLRSGSPDFGRHFGVELSAQNWKQLFVPAGFAHGYCTLEPDTEVLYKVDRYYAPAHENGVRWNDPALGIAWPIGAEEARLSEKDAALPALADIQSPFSYTPA